MKVSDLVWEPSSDYAPLRYTKVELESGKVLFIYEVANVGALRHNGKYNVWTAPPTALMKTGALDNFCTLESVLELQCYLYEVTSKVSESEVSESEVSESEVSENDN